MNTRIYIVKKTGQELSDVRLVEATSQSQALRHVIGGSYVAEAVTPKELAGWMQQGTRVESAIEAQQTGRQAT